MKIQLCLGLGRFRTLQWPASTDTHSHQPQGLLAFTTQPVSGEANFPGQDNETIESGSLATFGDGSLVQDSDNKHGKIVQDPSARSAVPVARPSQEFLVWPVD